MARVGIVGAGRAATLHAEAVRAAAGLELAGLAARSATAAAPLAAALGCPAVSLGELARTCDLAVVATPPAARHDVLAVLAASGSVRAVLVESPVGVTLAEVDRIRQLLAHLPTMVAANLLHAPAVQRLLSFADTIDPHHVELRLAVPDPARGDAGGRSFGGGVLVDPAAGFWPLLMAVLGAPLESVATPRCDLAEGLECRVEMILHAAGGGRALADLRWGARVAQASLELADAAHAARTDVWPVPVTEIDGVAADPPPRVGHPVWALGFVAQLDRLDRVGRGEAAAWPDLSVGSASLTVAVAAAVSARRGGEPVSVGEVPRGLSPFEVVNGAGRRS